jgi:metallophosphoesterase superfamily enzyme
MASPRADVSDRLDVTVAPGGKVVAISDLHLPPERTTVSGRSCEVIARRLAAETGPLTVVLAGDIVEMLSFPSRTAADVLGAHDDLCDAL